MIKKLARTRAEVGLSFEDLREGEGGLIYIMGRETPTPLGIHIWIKNTPTQPVVLLKQKIDWRWHNACLCIPH